MLANPPVTGVVPSTATPPDTNPPTTHHEFQVNCSVSRRNLPDDPIVFPGLPGASHSHTFMGNNSTNAQLDAGLAAGRRHLLHHAGRQDRVLDADPAQRRHRGAAGRAARSSTTRAGVIDYRSVRPSPPGLRYLVGSPNATQDEFRNAPGAVEGWECGDSAFNWDFPANCPAGTQLNVRMQAPSCWDGIHLDTPDHKSHMAYPTLGICPTSHPVAVPMIEFKMAFPVSGNMSNVRLSSGRGYSFHYDFYNVWDAADPERAGHATASTVACSVTRAASTCTSRTAERR